MFKRIIISIIFLVASYAMADDTTPEENTATYDNPFITDTPEIITVNNSFENTNIDQVIYITDKNSSEPLARLALDNPGKAIFVEIDPNEKQIESPPDVDSLWADYIQRKVLKSMGLDGDSLPLVPEEPYIPTLREEISIVDGIAGGTGSLDRRAVYTFIYVEGNGPSEYDWTEERLQYAMDQAWDAVINHRIQADSNGIKINPVIAYVYRPIDYEPIQESSGQGQAADLDVNSLDIWRSDCIGKLGFEPNLRGVYKYNMSQKGLYGAAEGTICFVVNFNEEQTHNSGWDADWACGWVPAYNVNKPYCSVSFNVEDSSVLAGKMGHELLHTFGAADEYGFAGQCQDQTSCTKGYGKLNGLNLNCAFCGLSYDCIMLGGTRYNDICHFTGKQVGWFDSDLNGGSDVDEIVSHTALVTGWFDLGQVFSLYTTDGDFVNVFCIAEHNSYLRPNGQRTVQVLGMNYQRQIIASGIYLGHVNGVGEVSVALNQDNNHDPLLISDLSANGPYLQFTATGIGHTNLEITNPSTEEVYQLFAGDLIAGYNTIYRFLFNDGQWLPDGSYTHFSRNWTCDGVWGYKYGQHEVNYGIPPVGLVNSASYNSADDNASATFTQNNWAENIEIYANGLLKTTVPGTANQAYWTHPRGSDSAVVQIKAVNPNGETFSSNDKFFITDPNPPEENSFACAIKVVRHWEIDCLEQPPDDGITKLGADEPESQQEEDDGCWYDVGYETNALNVDIKLPIDQCWSKVDYYVVKLSCYYETEWEEQFVTVEANNTYPGQVSTTIWELHPSTEYFGSIKTVDIRGNESEYIYPALSIMTGAVCVSPDKLYEEQYITGEGNIPDGYSLSQNHPNPFNPETEISLSLPIASNWEITIFNTIGQKVEQFSGVSEAGVVTDNWDASKMASGIYLYKAEAGTFSDTKKMLLLK